MLRLFVLFLAIAALAAGAAWFSDNPGDVAITWHGQRYEMSLAVALFGVLALAILLGMAWTLLRFALRLPSILSIASRARHHRKGLQSATKGLVAVGSGDSAGALRHAADARRLLGKGPLTLLLDAQAAQLSGDKDRARKAFEAMTRDHDTKILGLRGLYVEAKRSGDGEAARSAANEAVALAPSAAWANEAVLTDRFAVRDWQGAREALERAERLRVLDKSTSKRHRAVLLTAEALDILGTHPGDAMKKAQDAVALAPDLVPAAALAGRLLGEKGELRKATKILETAWKAMPHPDIADAYVHVRPGDSTHDRLDRAKTLARLMPRERESAFMVAKAAMDAQDSSAARAALDPVLTSQPTARACMLMAQIEDMEGHPGLAKGWLARIPFVARDRAWVADGHVSRHWAPVSPVTGRLDAFEWIDPPQDRMAALGPLEDMTVLEPAADMPMLPPRESPSQKAQTEMAIPAAASDNDSLVSQTVATPDMPPEQVPAQQAAADVTAEPVKAAIADSTGAPASKISSASALQPAIDAAATAATEMDAAKKTDRPFPISPSSSGAGARTADPLPQATPVVFPVPHAPDDPGPHKAKPPHPRRWRVFGG